MQPNNNPLPPPQILPPPAPIIKEPEGSPKAWALKHKYLIISGLLSVLLLANIAVSAWLFTKVNRYSNLSAVGLKQTTASSSTFNGDNTLFIDTQNKGVGVGASTPEGLQVGSQVTKSPRGSANIRAGLLNGEPALIFEDSHKQQDQLGISDGQLQFSSGSAVFSTVGSKGYNINNNLNVQGNTTLGKATIKSLTLQSTLAIPSSLSIGNNTLFISSGKGIALGSNNTNGYKLYVSGNSYNTGSIQAGGQIIVSRKSASTPAITFAGNTNTGLFSPGSNIVSLSAAGKETLRVASGAVSTQNGANLDIAGYLQAGSGGPSFKMVRYTGTLDGSGTGRVAHGISNAPKRVLVAMGWYESSSGQAKLLSVDYLDNSNFQVSGGVPGSAWRGVIIYTSDTAGW